MRNHLRIASCLVRSLEMDWDSTPTDRGRRGEDARETRQGSVEQLTSSTEATNRVPMPPCASMSARQVWKTINVLLQRPHTGDLARQCTCTRCGHVSNQRCNAKGPRHLLQPTLLPEAAAGERSGGWTRRWSASWLSRTGVRARAHAREHKPSRDVVVAEVLRTAAASSACAAACSCCWRTLWCPISSRMAYA